MAKVDMRTQVGLTRENPDGSVSKIVTWIDSKAAKIGNTMKIMDESVKDADWETGRWKVIWVGSELTDKRCRERAHFHTKYRAATDI